MQARTDTQTKAGTGRIQLAFRIDSRLTGEGLRSAVEQVRAGVEAKDRDRIEFAPPIRVKAPLPKLAFASGCAAFAVALVKHLAAAYRGGTIIDLREKTPLISRDRSLSRRSIRVLAADGTEQIATVSLPETTLDAILEGLLRLPRTLGGAGVSKAQVEAVVNRAISGRDRAGSPARDAVGS